MAKYRVKQLWLSGKGKLVFRSGDTVTSEHFPPGNVNQLLSNGAIEPLPDLPPVNPLPVKTSSKTVDQLRSELGMETPGPSKMEEKQPFTPSKAIQDWTVKELRKELNITDPNINKQALYDSWVEREKSKAA